MKKLVFGLIATVMFSFSGFANNNLEETSKINVQGFESSFYESNLTSDLTFDVVTNYNLFDATLCDVTVTVSVGYGATFASMTVTAKDIDCSKLIAEAKKLKAQLTAAIEG
ncbi:hypothetical protein [Flavobacterium sp.]|uniref:hypothetical protein n=1 Tax=Flavobacterium sp. TaxID=239 RepID=UPI003F6987AA